MDRSSIVIHYNDNLYNQRLYKDYLVSGFDRLGYNACATTSQNYDADVHVCIGPHYAYQQNKNNNTIYIDRCVWGNDLQYVSIGWLKECHISIPNNAPSDRDKPSIKPWNKGKPTKALYLLDYGPYPIEELHEAKSKYSVTIRPHPATNKQLPDLIDHLRGHHIVFGNKTSALVTAVIEGYPVVCKNRYSYVYPVASHDIINVKRPDRTQWLNNLSYLQWSGKEIASGAALEYVINHSADSRADNSSRG